MQQTTTGSLVSPKQAQDKASWLDLSLPRLLAWNWEKTAYLTIILVAIGARFYDLGVRAMSHDESLHALYSFYLFDGRGYKHDPMMHGPFLFHINTLFYFLFGVNDATARIAPVLTGILTVGAMWWLRPWLGRSGALIAALLLTISPAMLYYSRYIRNESFVALWAVWMLILTFKYLETRQPRYLYWLTVPYVLQFATKETSYIYAGLWVAFFLGHGLLSLAQEKWDRPQAKIPFFATLGGSAVFTGFAIKRVMDGTLGVADWIAAASLVIGAALLVGAFYLVWTSVGERLREDPSLDIAIWLGALAAPLFAPFLIRMVGWNPLDYSWPSGMGRSGLFYLVIQAAALGLGWMWLRHHFLIGLGIFYLIFTVLFTTFFTNGQGLATGTIGSLGYWLEQQGVERGSQPTYYYLIIASLYEFLPMVLSIAGAIALAIRPRLRAPDHTTEHGQEHGATHTITAPTGFFLLWWVAFAWFAYTWAGEKMPWLVVHISLPMILFGAWWLGKFIEGTDWRGVHQRGGLWLALFIPIFLAVISTLLTTRPFTDRTIDALSDTLQWLAALLVGLGVVYLGYQRIEKLGLRHTLTMTFSVLLVGLTLWTVRVSWMANYINFDNVKEYLVYAHGTGDIKLALSQIEDLSRRTVGDKQIRLSYDSSATWPLEWYLREYPNRVFIGTTPTRENLDSPVVIAGARGEPDIRPYLGDRYHRFSYRMVWWPREDYKHWNWDTIVSLFRDQAIRQHFWDVLIYRRYDTPLTEWPFVDRFALYVRKDVVADVWAFGAAPVVWAPAEPSVYEQGFRQIVAINQLGMTGVSGAAPGQLSLPRNVTVGPDGLIYVADSGNHRIQVFSPDGGVVRQWGSRCEMYSEGRPGCTGNGEGQFWEPWGIAVSDDGRIYVADTWNHRIQVFDSLGNFITQWGVFASTGGQLGEAGAFWGPRAIAVDADGNLYVTDTGNKRVQKFSPDGEFLGQWGGGGVIEGRFEEPVGIAIGPDGSIYVADTWNRRVQRFDANFTYLQEWSVDAWPSESVVNKPYLAVGPDGHVYVTDPENYRVLVFTATGDFVATWGMFGNDSQSFALPNGIAVDANGNIWVADADNHRIMQFPFPLT